MLVLSVHPVRGLLGVINRSHNSSRLIRLAHLSSSGHGHLARLLIRHIRLSHWLYLTMPLRALRGLMFHTRSLDNHAIAQFLRGPHLHTLGLEFSKPLHPLLEDAETVFTDRHVVEPGSSEAHRGQFVDCTHSETTSLASPSSVQDGFALCLSSGVRI